MPRTGATPASSSPGLVDQADELAAVWADDEPDEPDEPAPDAGLCDDCGDPLEFEPAGTALVCPTCDTVTVPPTAGQAYQREETAAVAVRVDPAVAMRDALDLATAQGQLQDRAARLAGEWEPGDLPSGDARTLCVGVSSRARALARMAGQAPTLADLVPIRDHLAQLETEASQQLFRVDYERQRAGIDPRERPVARLPMAHQVADYDDDDYDDDDYDDDEPDDDGYAYDERDTRRPATTPTRAGMDAGSNLYSALAALGTHVKNQRDAAQARRARWGECQYPHRRGEPPTATREYQSWMPNQYLSGGMVLNPRGPVVRCCSKHYAEAEQYISQHGFTPYHEELR